MICVACWVVPSLAVERGCTWTAFMQECYNPGVIVTANSWEEFRETMRNQSRRDMHLVTMDYGDGVYMGYYEPMPGTPQFVLTPNSEEFSDILQSAASDGFGVTALAYTPEGYFAWLREAPEQDSLYCSATTQEFLLGDCLQDTLDDGWTCTSMLGTGEDFFIFWFQLLPSSPNRWAYRKGLRNVTATVNKNRPEGFVVTALAHDDDDWVIWFRQDLESRTKGFWAVRRRPQVLESWINSIHRRTGRHCVTALAYGCN